MFSYLSAEQRVPLTHPLRAVRKVADKILAELSKLFARMYSEMGRPSIPPEKLLRALLLQVLYTMRSECMLIEQLDYNILFRWFVGLNLDEEVWDVTVFTKNRDRLLEADVAKEFFGLVVAEAQALNLMSDEHFTVDGTPLEACASLKSFKRETEYRRLRRRIRATPRWTFTGRRAATTRMSPRRIPMLCWRAKGPGKKPS